MWIPLKLKVDEARYFIGQLRAHERYPSQFLFFLSAFLSSSRSITFHIQKQFSSCDRDLYEGLRDEMLRDALCSYFVGARNHVEKVGYLPVWLAILAGRVDPVSGNLVWTQNAKWGLFDSEDGRYGLDFVENLLKNEWALTHARSSDSPAQIRYHWTFLDFPAGEKEVASACEEYLDRLWSLLVRARIRWVERHSPGQIERDWGKWFFSFGQSPDRG